VVVQQPRNGDLLLIAARQLADRLARVAARDAEPLDPSGRGRALSRRHDGERRPERLEARERHVVGDAQSERHAFASPLFAEHADALLPSRMRRRRTRISAYNDLAAPDRLEAED